MDERAECRKPVHVDSEQIRDQPTPGDAVSARSERRPAMRPMIPMTRAPGSQNDPCLHGCKVQDKLHHQRDQEVGAHEPCVVEKYHQRGQHKRHVTIEPQMHDRMRDPQFRDDKQPENTLLMPNSPRMYLEPQPYCCPCDSARSSATRKIVIVQRPGTSMVFSVVGKVCGRRVRGNTMPSTPLGSARKKMARQLYCWTR